MAWMSMQSNLYISPIGLHLFKDDLQSLFVLCVRRRVNAFCAVDCSKQQVLSTDY